MDRVPGRLDQTSVVGDVLAELSALRIRIQHPVLAKDLRRLGEPEAVAGKGVLNLLLSVDALERIDNRDAEDRCPGLARLLEDGVDVRGFHAGPDCIMDG